MKQFFQLTGVLLALLFCQTNTSAQQSQPYRTYQTYQAPTCTNTCSSARRSINVSAAANESHNKFRYTCSFNPELTTQLQSYLSRELGAQSSNRNWTNWQYRNVSGFNVSLYNGYITINYRKKYLRDEFVNDIKVLMNGIKDALFDA